MLKKIFISAVSILTLLLSSLNIAPAREIVEVPHWKKKIITVYISPEGGDAKIRPMIKSSFSRWQGNSSGHIMFQYPTDPKVPADIFVIFPTKDAPVQGGLTSVNLNIKNNEISEVKYYINTDSDTYKKSSGTYLSKVLLHDVGTILGLPTNTTKKSSIMYSPVTENQDIMKIDVRKLFSVSGWSYAKRNIESKNTKEEE